MLDLHSGSEYGAARIAAMIAAAVTIVLTVLAAFGSMVPYAQADSFGALTINAVWGRDTASPKSLAGDTYSIVRVATVTTNNDGSVSSYKTVGDFSGLAADWERLTSSEYHDAAKKLATHAAKNKLYQHSGTTNELVSSLSRICRSAYIWSPARARRKSTKHTTVIRSSSRFLAVETHPLISTSQ